MPWSDSSKVFAPISSIQALLPTLLVSILPLLPLNLLSQLSCPWDPSSKQLPEAKPRSPVYSSSTLLLIQSTRTPCNISLAYCLSPKITSLAQSSILESACIYSGDLCGCTVCGMQQHLATDIFVINLGTEFDTIFILRELRDQLAWTINI